jgi:hypothetical protein
MRDARLGIAALLVGFGFVLGRLTAPTPSVTSGPIAAEPPMAAKVSSAEELVKAIPAPHPAPLDTTVPTAEAAPSSVPNEPVQAVAAPPAPTTAPPVARLPVAHIPAPDAPARAGTTVRAVVSPPARSERPEPAQEVTPPSSPEAVNPLVQAVQDDIREDETARKKR